MDTSKQKMSTKLIGLRCMMSTQMSLLLGCFKINQSFRIRLLQTQWISNEPIHSYSLIPYKLHQYMPHSILVLIIQFMLLLLLYRLSNAFLEFSPSLFQILFSFDVFIFIHSVLECAYIFLLDSVTDNIATNCIRWSMVWRQVGQFFIHSNQSILYCGTGCQS